MGYSNEIKLYKNKLYKNDIKIPNIFNIISFTEKNVYIIDMKLDISREDEETIKIPIKIAKPTHPDLSRALWSN